VRPECETMRSHSLPLHGTLLSRDDRAGTRPRLGCGFGRDLWMDCVGHHHRRRQQAHLVDDRAGMGKILVDISGGGALLPLATSGAARYSPWQPTPSRIQPGPLASLNFTPHRIALCLAGRTGWKAKFLIGGAEGVGRQRLCSLDCNLNKETAYARAFH
jgi:hypothetical protein